MGFGLSDAKAAYRETFRIDSFSLKSISNAAETFSGTANGGESQKLKKDDKLEDILMDTLHINEKSLFVRIRF